MTFFIYMTAVVCGNVAYFICDGKRLFFNHHRMRYDWPDPDTVPVILVFLLSPLPGLVAIGNFILAVRERMVRSDGSRS